MAKQKFFKLGKNASVFFDSSTGLKVTPGQAAGIDGKAANISKKIRAAVDGRHIIVIEEAEAKKINEAYAKGLEAAKAGKPAPKKVETTDEDDEDEGWDKSMTNAQLDAYFAETYPDEDQEEFEEMVKADKIAKLEELEEEDEE